MIKYMIKNWDSMLVIILSAATAAMIIRRLFGH
jgi:hypothetical protein